VSYLEHLRHEPAEVKLVSCADKLHNCSTLVRDVRLHGPETLDRFSGGREGTLWYYASVAEALGHEWHHWLLDELRREVGALHHLVGIEVGAARPSRA
jgi:(p)ppGpp synthase/HD superfamily hydrolase